MKFFIVLYLGILHRSPKPWDLDFRAIFVNWASKIGVILSANDLSHKNICSDAKEVAIAAATKGKRLQ